MAMNNPTYLGGTIQTGPILISSTTSTSNPPLSFNDSGVFLAAGATVADYVQVVLQNLSNGATASTDFVAGNDLQTASTFYGNFGMNSSGFAGTGAFNAASAVYVTATSGDLALGTTTANAIHFVANGAATDAMTITAGNVAQIGGRNVATVPLFTPFASSGTFTPKASSTVIAYTLVGAGGQGGYGGNYLAASGGSGGGGGGAGGINFGIMQASSFGATSTVTVGAGGTGAGNSGTPQGAKGGITQITLTAGSRYAGGGGGGGPAAVTTVSGGGGSASNLNAQASNGGASGGGGASTTFGANGGSGASGSNPGASAVMTTGSSGAGTTAAGIAGAGGGTSWGTSGGGSGGGFAVGGAAQAGGSGGTSIIDGAASSPAGGAATGAAGTAGSQDTYVTLGQGFPSTGGGGGGANAAGNGGNGGAGGLGSGGGGGGAAPTGNTGGTGGNGGNGYVIFLEW